MGWNACVAGGWTAHLMRTARHVGGFAVYGMEVKRRLGFLGCAAIPRPRLTVVDRLAYSLGEQVRGDGGDATSGTH